MDLTPEPALVAVADAHRLRPVRLWAADVPPALVQPAALIHLLERRGSLAAVWAESD